MKKISWIEISLKQYGGFAYNDLARVSLGRYFDVRLVLTTIQVFRKFRPLKFLEIMWRLARLKGESDVWIRNFYAVLTMPMDRTRGKQVVVRHHADFSGFPLISRPFFWILEKIFEHNAKKLDAIVVVSQYWKTYFEKKGFSNVYLIFNGFHLEDFEISQEEVNEFKKSWKLEGRPIIYLGNCQKPKGVKESWNALKDFHAHLVTSGRRMIQIPAQNLELEYRDYLKLLKASSVVVAMSRFQEGWSRTAHEAMLLKTPVIGSGRGGMRELLEGGQQMVCEDISKLKEMVEYLLANETARKEQGERGYRFASQFSKERFQEDWIRLVHKIL